MWQSPAHAKTLPSKNGKLEDFRLDEEVKQGEAKTYNV